MIQLALRQRFQVDEEGSAFIFCVLLGFCGLAFDDVFSAVVGIGSGGAHGCYYFVRCGVLGLRGPAGLGCPVPTKAFCPDRRSTGHFSDVHTRYSIANLNDSLTIMAQQKSR